jgi:hypothetical protein
MDLGEIGGGDDGRWMELAQDRVQWRGFCVSGVEPSGSAVYEALITLSGNQCNKIVMFLANFFYKFRHIYEI